MKQSQTLDNVQLYHQTAAEFFGKVTKILPKNKKDLKTDIEKILAAMSKEKEFTNANGLIKVMKDLLDLKVSKITELTLAFLEKLVSLGMIDGHEVNIVSKKKCVDEVLQMIVECIGLREDTILFLVIKALHSLTLVAFSAVYGDNLEFIVQALISIYSQNSTSSKNTQISGLAMLSLRNIVRRVFERMERYSETTVEQEEIFCLKRCITVNRAGEFLFQDANLPNNHNSSNNYTINSNTSLFQSNSTTSPKQSFSSLKEATQYYSPNLGNPSSSTDLSEQEALDPTNFLSMPVIPYPGLLERPLNFEEKDIDLHIRTYCDKQIQNLVDQTVLFDERSKRAAEDKYEESHINVPIQSVPPQGKENTPEFARIIQVNLANEAGQIAGKFGWCFVCRQKAEFYCKQTRVPICSQECKQTHLTAIDDVQYMLQNKYKSIPKDQYFNDGMTLFKFLCNLSKRDGANLNSQMNPQSLKSKVISLEMLKLIMENSGVVFLSSFAGLVKDSLVHSVLVNSVSQELRVVQLSLSILTYLFQDFRDQLKKEIEMFVRDILIQMLESMNTNYQMRALVLQVFGTILKAPRVILEFFVNYDCQVSHLNIAQVIIELLCKIAQGKYARPEFQSVITETQEQSLRQSALRQLMETFKLLVPFTMLSEELQQTPSEKLSPKGISEHKILTNVKGDAQLIQSPVQIKHSREIDLQSFLVGSEKSDFGDISISPHKESSEANDGDNNTNNVQEESKRETITQMDSSSPAISSETVTLNNIANIEESLLEQRKRKNIIQKCVEKFNFKVKEGLKFAFEQQICFKITDLSKKPSETDENALKLWNNSVEQLSGFFFSQRTNLSKTAMGKFFGDENKYNQDVFSEFLQLIDMSNMNIVEGLRALFRVVYPPGETEAIDRIIQQFGEKYIRDNPSEFKNAGVAYTLAFAIMMLQTNLYNTQVKKEDKMTLQSFTKLVMGISDGENLQAEQVTQIYNSVKEEQLGIHDSQQYQIKRKEAINSDLLIKTKKFKEEQEKMLQQGKLWISKDSGNNNNNNNNNIEDNKYLQVLSGVFTRDLLEAVWSSLFATFSACLEQNNEKSGLMLSLEGLKYGAVLLGKYQLYFEQHTFVLSLAKNTGLLVDNQQQQQQQQQQPFSVKNILSTSTLIEIASIFGNHLRQSWKIVLQCLSRIDFYISEEYLPTQSQANKNLINNLNPTFEIERHNQRLLEISLSQETIEKVFAQTAKFDCESLIDFIDCLCEQCSEEVFTSKTDARVYSLRRISEVAELNMDRLRYEWNQIWPRLSQLFSQVGQSQNISHSLLVIDLLKQLALKFLRKNELSHYAFQRVFLQPFIAIFDHANGKLEVYQLILSCVKVIVAVQFQNVRSGWSVIMSLISKSLDRNDPSLLAISVQIFDEIFKGNRSLENLSEVLVDLAQVLSRVLSIPNEESCLNCIGYLNKLMDYLVFLQNSSSLMNSELLKQSQLTQSKKIIEFNRMLESLWLPVLIRLGGLFSDRRPSVQRKSIEVLFKLLESHGGSFTGEFWQELFTRLLSPYFEFLTVCAVSTAAAQDPNSIMNKDSQQVAFIRDSCQICFDSLVELIIKHFFQAQDALTHLLALLFKAIISFNPIISKIAAEQTKNLITGVWEQLSSSQIDEILRFIDKLFMQSLPVELLDPPKKYSEYKMTYEEAITSKQLKELSQDAKSISLNEQRIQTQITVQLLLISTVQQSFVQHAEQFTSEALERIKRQLYDAYQFSTTFNSFIVFRYSLAQQGFMNENGFPNLLVLQRDSRSMLLQIWFENYLREKQAGSYSSPNKSKTSFVKLFLDNSIASISKFVEYSRSIIEAEEEFTILQQEAKRYSIVSQTMANSIQNMAKQIKMQYLLEKSTYVFHLRSNLAQIILPKMRYIHPEEFADRIAEIVDALVELSEFSFPRSILQLTCLSCQKCESCKMKQADSFDLDLTKLLKSLFAFTASLARNGWDNNKNEGKQTEDANLNLRKSCSLEKQIRNENGESHSNNNSNIIQLSKTLQTSQDFDEPIQDENHNNTVEEDSEKQQQKLLQEQQLGTEFSRGLAEIASKVEEGQLSDTQAVKEEKQSTNNQNVPGEEQQTLNQQDTEITAVENNNDSNNNDKENQKEQQSKERSQIIGNDGDKENTVDATEETNAKEDQAAMIEQKVEIKEELSNPSQQESQ